MKKLMFWHYMADKKLIDVKPTKKEIFYGFFCTGISLVLLIIFGISIVFIANKYMKNMKGNQNYLENLTTLTTTQTLLKSSTNDVTKETQNPIDASKMSIVSMMATSIPTSTVSSSSSSLTSQTSSVSSPFSVTNNVKIPSELDNENWFEQQNELSESSYIYSEIKIKEITGKEATFTDTINETLDNNMSDEI